MSTGELLGLWLTAIIVQVLAWGAVDLAVFKSGKQTLTQWVIKEAGKRKTFAYFILTALTAFQALIVWLFFHFELPRLL